MSLPGPIPLVRPSTPDDLDAVRSIYADAVSRGTSSFELQAPDAAEMARRRAEVAAAGWPWLVVEQAGQVCGFAYAVQYRPRPAYRHCVEDSIYLHPDAQGRRLGRWLLAELVARCEAAGARQMVAVIGDAASAGSIGLHRALGFVPCGQLEAVGWKFGRWLDVVLMQRALGPGSRCAAR